MTDTSSTQNPQNTVTLTQQQVKTLLGLARQIDAAQTLYDSGKIGVRGGEPGTMAINPADSRHDMLYLLHQVKEELIEALDPQPEPAETEVLDLVSHDDMYDDLEDDEDFDLDDYDEDDDYDF